MAGSLVTAWGRATSVEFDPDVLDSFVASGVSEQPEPQSPDDQRIKRRYDRSRKPISPRDISAYLLGAMKSVGKRSVPFS